MSKLKVVHMDHNPKNKAPHAVPPHMMRHHKAIAIGGKQMATMIANCADTAALLPTFFDHKTSLELLNLQQAIVNRILEQQKNWFKGISGVMQQYNEVKEVNTITKYVEREYNIIAQMSHLIAQQVTGWTEMMENIQVDLSYWIEQKKQDGLQQLP